MDQPMPRFHVSEKPREETASSHSFVIIYYSSLTKLIHVYLEKEEWKQVEGKAGLRHCQLSLCTNAKVRKDEARDSGTECGQVREWAVVSPRTPTPKAAWILSHIVSFSLRCACSGSSMLVSKPRS